MSTRPHDPANITASQARHVTAINLIRADFSTGVRYISDAPGFPVSFTHPTYGAVTYEGIGGLGGIAGNIKTTARPSTQRYRYLLEGVNATLVAELRGAQYFNRPFEHRVGFLNEGGGLIATPGIETVGVMDNAVYDASKSVSNVTLTVRDSGPDVRSASGWLMTDEHQQRLYPGDLYFQYLYRMMNLDLEWFNHRFAPPIFNPVNSRRNLPEDFRGIAF